MRIFVALAVVLFAATARADVPPEPRSMAADCTLETHCASGGRACPVGMRVDQEESARCTAAAEEAGLVYRCSAGGNYVATAVYCPADAPGGCSVEEQCPGGKRCRAGDPCDVAGHYERCVIPPRGDDESWYTVYCPEGTDPPSSGQSASAGCGACSAGAARSGASLPLAMVVALFVALRRARER